ncbi:hypothetical protein [Stenotrophomonas maltophilia]|uniref:hypothetical protein n=1 Tax=Stenotrophomonas maltophilia TaxID=40324 RepID=UPI00069F98B4|nr:hypothetical protein [Stenotrophomonas maltophilia]
MQNNAYTTSQMWDYARAALSAQPSPASSLDLEAMLAACVPGGDIADPQVIADNIRHWFAAQPSPGGQGALADAARRVISDIDSGDYHGEISEATYAALEAALAARQPVGEKPERRAPVQGYHGETIPWRVHGLAWEAYAKKYGKQQSAERIAERGGFGCEEMDMFVPGWREMVEGSPAHAVDLAPRPMDTAPTDGTLVRLLVDFTSNAIEDTAGPAWTIGSNNDSNVMADERVGWQFAGWCWDHDHFTEGEGTPVGWLPLVGAPAQAVDLGQFRPAVELMEWQERGHANPDFPRGDAQKHAEALRLLALIDSQAVGK